MPLGRFHFWAVKQVSQSTKLFIVLGFMFIVFTTLNGHLERYLRVVFGTAKTANDAPSAVNKTANKIGGVIGDGIKIGSKILLHF